MGRIEEIAARAEKATHGEWEADDDEGFSIWRIRAPGKLIAEVVGDSAETDATAEFIAHARQDVPWLLEQLKAAQRAIEAARELRIYCLGSDASTRGLIERFDSAIAALDRPESYVDSERK